MRETGLARERDEAVLGESSVAAPIHDSAGHAVGAIGVVGDTERILPRGPARGLGPAVIEAARSVSRELGRRALDRRLIRRPRRLKGSASRAVDMSACAQRIRDNRGFTLIELHGGRS